MPRRAEKKTGAGSSQATVAKHLDMVQQRVAQFVADGTFVTLPNGKLDVDDCRIRYIRWLRDETRKSSASVSASRVQVARAELIELQTAKERGELIPILEVTEFLEETVGVFRSELAGLAAASTRDLAVRQAIDNHLDAAIDRCRAYFDGGKAAVHNRKPISGAHDGNEDET